MKYENSWESLDTRPVPGWFADAKFGIFIHWGIYSVPAYAPKGKYAEWYGRWCDERTDNDPEYYDYHVKTYGRDFKYNDFAGMFKAENFDAGEWIRLFEDAGAGYMNLVSKHHDGFCMYKSSYAPNWNSVDIGPHRDFCRELADAAKGSAVRFGVYHSVYEWFHPLYLKDPEEYALKHLLPMLKELIEKYEPATLFTDGEWEHPAEVWHSTEFLQWLYNDSPVRDFIVPNDRWGSETRGRHGGNLTTEYGFVGSGDGNNELLADKPSEECRGIGKSFGWNKFEQVGDYLSAQELISLFVDLISAGSNLLLNVGPTPDGRIPVIMEERLRQMGAWLKVNGEAVYGSRRYTCDRSGELRYTKKGNGIFAFIKRYPAGKIVLDAVPFDPDLKAEILGCDQSISTFDADGRLGVDCGFINPDKMKSKYAYTVKLSLS